MVSICGDCVYKLLEFWMRERRILAIKTRDGRVLIGRLKAVLYNPRLRGPHSFTLALQKPDGAMVTIHGFLSAEVLDAPDKESLRRIQK
ncbi:hypothetical protein DRO19_00400 [Candidatus Bathyarchaeota archaeon]|nr:MAG: hypothetical protein DRO19_00400 [Candidatus Bathyarchaeota archaeon]